MRLRFLIFLTFASIAVFPVVALAIWIFNDALNREIESVKDKHLVIAKNVGQALEEYANDLKNGFELVAHLPRAEQKSHAISHFMETLHFNHLCIVDLKTGVIDVAVAPDSLPCPKRVPPDRLRTFKNLLQDNRVVFSPLMPSAQGDPVFYLLRAYGDKLQIGAVSTAYIVKRGGDVSFGERGHAAIVDQTGQVIAHPLPAWQSSIKNIAKLPPVARMMARETGTMLFHSPAFEADMVSGYTFVPLTGWGVMVPQPLAEIRAAATVIQRSAIGISIGGIVGAALLSWFLSGYLTRSLSSVVQSAKRMAAGKFDARVEIEPGFATNEIRELGLVFNAMADEVAKTNHNLSEAVTQADAANRAKSEFLATMSHDLRTPLNAIIGFAQAMRSKIFGPLGSPRYEEYLGDIETSGNVLLSLIDDILDLSKIEAGRYELYEEAVDLSVFLRNSIELADILAQKNDVRLALLIQDDIPELYCDERTLMQIVNNLLSNAVKFSHNGGQVLVSARQGAAGTVDIEFSDQGIGMTARDAEDVLKPFRQADSGKAREYQGTGLGLPICQKFMELHGGSLVIESALGTGTTVTICFPADRALRPAKMVGGLPN